MLFTALQIICALHFYGQNGCKDGFTKVRLNGKKVSAPCLDYNAGKELKLKIDYSDSTDISHPYLLDVTFINPTDSIKTIYWYDFVKSWGVPLSFSFDLQDSTGGVIYENRNWQLYMDPSVFYKKPRVNEEIPIPPHESYTQTIHIWWPGGMRKGSYQFTLKYGGYHWPSIIDSNTLEIEIGSQ